MFTPTCRLLTQPGRQQTVKWEPPLLPQYHSPRPCPIHCSLVFWALLTSEKYQPIHLPDFLGCQDPETFLYFLLFMLISFSSLWKAVATCYNSYYTSPCAYSSAMPFCSRLARSPIVFPLEKKSCSIKQKRSCYDMCIKDIKQQPEMPSFTSFKFHK